MTEGNNNKRETLPDRSLSEISAFHYAAFSTSCAAPKTAFAARRLSATLGGPIVELKILSQPNTQSRWDFTRSQIHIPVFYAPLILSFMKNETSVEGTAQPNNLIMTEWRRGKGLFMAGQQIPCKNDQMKKRPSRICRSRNCHRKLAIRNFGLTYYWGFTFRFLGGAGGVFSFPTRVSCALIC